MSHCRETEAGVNHRLLIVKLHFLLLCLPTTGENAGVSEISVTQLRPPPIPPPSSFRVLTTARSQDLD